jgi:hypothetical protein
VASAEDFLDFVEELIVGKRFGEVGFAVEFGALDFRHVIRERTESERFSGNGERRPLACGVPCHTTRWSSPSQRRQHASRVLSPVNGIVPAKRDVSSSMTKIVFS